MNKTKTVLLFAIFAIMVSFLFVPEPAQASGPIIARGAERQAIKSTHILDRKNRPLHVYGNTVRRRAARRR